MNLYIATIKSLKETLSLIRDYSWVNMYSEYKTGEDQHIEVATWQ